MSFSLQSGSESSNTLEVGVRHSEDVHEVPKAFAADPEKASVEVEQTAVQPPPGAFNPAEHPGRRTERPGLWSWVLGAHCSAPLG